MQDHFCTTLSRTDLAPDSEVGLAAFVGWFILLQPSDGVWIIAVGTLGSIATFNVSGAGTGSGPGHLPRKQPLGNLLVRHRAEFVHPGCTNVELSFVF